MLKIGDKVRRKVIYLNWDWRGMNQIYTIRSFNSTGDSLTLDEKEHGALWDTSKFELVEINTDEYANFGIKDGLYV